MLPTQARASAALRAGGLLLIGALVMHELRYALDPAAGATGWAAEHGYLTALAPILAAAGASLALAGLARSALLGRNGARRRAGVDRAALYAGGLLAVHLVQEGVELLASGAGPAQLPAGLAAVAGLGIPLAMALGALGALLARLLDRAEDALAARLVQPPSRRLRASQALALATAPRVDFILCLDLAPRPPPRGI